MPAESEFQVTRRRRSERSDLNAMPYQTTIDSVLLKHPKVGKALNILRCRAFIPL